MWKCVFIALSDCAAVCAPRATIVNQTVCQHRKRARSPIGALVLFRGRYTMVCAQNTFDGRLCRQPLGIAGTERILLQDPSGHFSFSGLRIDDFRPCEPEQGTLGAFQYLVGRIRPPKTEVFQVYDEAQAFVFWCPLRQGVQAFIKMHAIASRADCDNREHQSAFKTYASQPLFESRGVDKHRSGPLWAGFCPQLIVRAPSRETGS